MFNTHFPALLVETTVKEAQNFIFSLHFNVIYKRKMLGLVGSIVLPVFKLRATNAHKSTRGVQIN